MKPHNKLMQSDLLKRYAHRSNAPSKRPIEIAEKKKKCVIANVKFKYPTIQRSMLSLVSDAAMDQPILESTLTCPECRHKKTEIMPTGSCQYYYECESCHTLLKPKTGDCCVFCSFGSVKCPSIQQDSSCGA